MKRREEVTLTNMCMIEKGKKILVLKRSDPVWPGLAFPGGHVKAHESFNDSVIREVKEETGLSIKKPKLVGLKQFYDRDDYRYLVLFYIARDFTGVLRDSKEGHVFWLAQNELRSHQLAYNFDHDLPVFFNQEISEHMLDGNRDELF